MRTERQFCEQIMTVHWNMSQCSCSLCTYGRSHNYGPMVDYLSGQLDSVDADVLVLAVRLLNEHFLCLPQGKDKL